MNQVLVVCIGNSLVADDAAGYLVYESLLSANLPDDVKLILSGVGGIQLLDWLNGEDLLVVVDAVRFGAPPGTVHVLDWDELPVSPGRPVSNHGVGILEVLSIAKQLYPDRVPKHVRLIGIEGRCFDRIDLPASPEVFGGVDMAVVKVIEEIDDEIAVLV